MACMKHDWFFLTACPACAREATPSLNAAAPPVEAPPVAGVEEAAVVTSAGVPAEVTAPVTEPALPEPPLPDFYCCERVILDIPPFLMRRAGGGFKYPRFHNPSGKALQIAFAAPQPGDQRTPQARPIRDWTDTELMAATSANMSVRDRQPILRELHRREDTKKARERIAKLKESKRRDD